MIEYVKIISYFLLQVNSEQGNLKYATTIVYFFTLSYVKSPICRNEKNFLQKPLAFLPNIWYNISQ